MLRLDSGSPSLRPTTRRLIEDHRLSGNILAVSAVSAWEIALLADLGRIMLDVPADTWLLRFLAGPGIESVPLSPTAAVRAYPLDGLPHRDPADRMLVATAIELACPLVTYDERLLAFAAEHGAGVGFSAVSE